MVCKVNYAVIVTMILPSGVWCEPSIFVMSGTYRLVTSESIEEWA